MHERMREAESKTRTKERGREDEAHQQSSRTDDQAATEEELLT
jgi:hypothetical protein